jgi:hypothetical protein
MWPAIICAGDLHPPPWFILCSGAGGSFETDMITEEEVRAKLSMDTTMLGRAKRDIAEFSHSGHSGFVHVGSSQEW